MTNPIPTPNLSSPAEGFAAGTLVHTRQGLRPIQTLKVGDEVLSKPESGEGELAYKRITQTFCHQDKEVWYMSYVTVGTRTAEGPVLNEFIQSGEEYLIATPNHPFWVEAEFNFDGVEDETGRWPHYTPGFQPQWRALENLMSGDLLMLSEGQLVSVCHFGPIWKTRKEGQGWHQAQYGNMDIWEDNKGGFVEFYPDKVIAAMVSMDHNQTPYFGYVDFRKTFGKGWTEHSPYLAPVYNIEVEDFHTYFVGNFGLWVHNIQTPAGF